MYFSYLATGIDINTDMLRSVRPTGEYELKQRSAFGAAMRREYMDMPFSRRGERVYTELRKQRRADLEALLVRGLNEESTAKALDIVFAICEESFWAENEPHCYDDEAHPDIDMAAAKTASLLAWAVHEMKPELRLHMRILRELRRRIFIPIMAHDDYRCFDAHFPYAIGVLCEIMTAAILCEKDIMRMQSLLRRLAPVADKIIELPACGDIKTMLENWTSAAALWRIACTVTGPQATSRPLPLNRWLDTLLYAYLGEGMFLDPCGAGVIKGVNGADVYFLGMAAGDEVVQILGEELMRDEKTEISALSACITVDLGKENISAARPVPRYRHAAVEDNSIMTARGAGAYVAVAASGRGGFCVYFDDAPAIYACGSESLKLNGAGLNNCICAGEADFEDVRADMSVDMTPALPKGRGVRFMQRTIMLDRDTGIIRMVDMVECDVPGEIEYVFAAPAAPVKEGGGARMGAGYISWDAGAKEATGECRMNGLPDMHCLKLIYSTEPGSNIFNFIIERA